MTDPVVRSSDDPPPVDAYGRGRRWLLVTCGGLLALALLVVAFNLDGPDDPVRPSDDGSPVAEIRPPSIADGASGGFSNVREGDFVLERGGWVQIADAQGRLVQEYTATRLEPKPGGEIELINPSGRFYLSNNRILVVSGDQATARRRDNRMLESGRISGNVRIALYEGTRDTLPDPRTMAPSVYVTTSEAVFDNLRGEIRCDADLHVQTTSMEFFGRGLLADYDKVYGLRRLTIDEATRPIRIAGAALAKATSGSTEAAPSTDGASTLRHAPDLTGPHAAPGGVSGRGLELPPFVASVRPQSAPPRPGPDASAAERRDWLRARREMAERRAREASRQAEPDRFYRATFERDVHLWRGVEADPDQFITGDVLRLVFSMDNSELRESSVAAAGRSRSGGAWIPSIRPRDVVATLVLAAAQDPVDPSRVAPAPGPDDVYLSYAGRLIVLPVEPGEVHLASKDDVHAELVGSPVTLVDRAKEATATCGRIEYITAGERLALLGTDEHTLTLDSSEISLKGTRFDYSVRDSRGELVGPGMMHHARPDQFAPAVADAVVEARSLERDFAAVERERVLVGAKQRQSLARGDVLDASARGRSFLGPVHQRDGRADQLGMNVVLRRQMHFAGLHRQHDEPPGIGEVDVVRPRCWRHARGINGILRRREHQRRHHVARADAGNPRPAASRPTRRRHRRLAQFGVVHRENQAKHVPGDELVRIGLDASPQVYVALERGAVEAIGLGLTRRFAGAALGHLAPGAQPVAPLRRRGIRTGAGRGRLRTHRGDERRQLQPATRHAARRGVGTGQIRRVTKRGGAVGGRRGFRRTARRLRQRRSRDADRPSRLVDRQPPQSVHLVVIGQQAAPEELHARGLHVQVGVAADLAAQVVEHRLAGGHIDRWRHGARIGQGIPCSFVECDAHVAADAARFQHAVVAPARRGLVARHHEDAVIRQVKPAAGVDELDLSARLRLQASGGVLLHQASLGVGDLHPAAALQDEVALAHVGEPARRPIGDRRRPDLRDRRPVIRRTHRIVRTIQVERHHQQGQGQQAAARHQQPATPAAVGVHGRGIIRRTDDGVSHGPGFRRGPRRPTSGCAP